MSDATNSLKQGAESPYDAPDSWNKSSHSIPRVPAPPAVDWAHAAARGVISDLTDRRGIKEGFHDVDEEVRAELIASLADIIRAASGGGTAAAELYKALQWYVTTDEVNEGDSENQPWIEGKRRAEAALRGADAAGISAGVPTGSDNQGLPS